MPVSIWGELYPILEVASTSEQIPLERTKMDYSFFNADVIEHVSVFTGFRSYAYSRNQSSFQLNINFCHFSASQENNIFQKIYQNKDQAFHFYPHSDYATASVDVFGESIEYYITEFTPYYLDSQFNYDGLIINLSPRKNSVLWASNIELGYGYTYGLNYGVGF